MAVGPQGAVEYLQNLAVAYDSLMNAYTGGSAHGTFSARAWRAKCRGKRWGAAAVSLLDGTVVLFGGEPEHCRRANEREAVVLQALVDAELATRATS